MENTGFDIMTKSLQIKKQADMYMQFEQSTGCALLRMIYKIKADKSFFCATKWFLLHRQGRMWLSVTQYYSDLYSGFQFYFSRKRKKSCSRPVLNRGPFAC